MALAIVLWMGAVGVFAATFEIGRRAAQKVCTSARDAHGTNRRSWRITRWVVLTALGVWSSYTLVVFGALVYPIEGAYDAPQTGFVALYLAAGLIGAVGLALATARRRFGSGHADDA